MKGQELHWGVEIECYIPSEVAEAFPVGRYHSGLPSPLLPEGWNCQEDGSLYGGPADGHSYQPTEVVSPVLSGEDGLFQVVYVVNLLASLGVKTNSTTGLHVHVGAEGLDRGMLPELQRQFIRLEKALYSLSGADAHSRWNNTYCRRSDQWDATRYNSLNLDNYQPGRRKNTVEFRLWQSTLDDTAVVAAISLAVSIVARVTEGYRVDSTARIPDRVAASRILAREYVTHPDARIVPDAAIADVVLGYFRNVRKATI